MSDPSLPSLREEWGQLKLREQLTVLVLAPIVFGGLFGGLCILFVLIRIAKFADRARTWTIGE